jgi:hypothetical protein
VATCARGSTCCRRKCGIWKATASFHKSVRRKASISAYSIKYCWKGDDE